MPSSFILPFKPPPRIGLIEPEQAVEQLGMELVQVLRLLEEAFRAIGEQLSAVLGGCVVQKGLAAGGQVAAELGQIAVEDCRSSGRAAAALPSGGMPPISPSSRSRWWANSCSTTFSPSAGSRLP